MGLKIESRHPEPSDHPEGVGAVHGSMNEEPDQPFPPEIFEKGSGEQPGQKDDDALGGQREKDGIPQGKPEDGILQCRGEVPQTDDPDRGVPGGGVAQGVQTARTKGLRSSPR